MVNLTRRGALGVIGGTAASLGLPAYAADRSIRHFWWGNPERDKRTFAVIEVFQKNHPDISVSGETMGWGDYWTKMATQTAGRNMADVIQMDYRFLSEYVLRGALKPLDPHIGKTLDLSNFDEGPLSGGYVDGKLYAINIGSNSQGLAINARMFEEYGVDADIYTWDWAEFAAACDKITTASNGAVKGSEDMSLSESMMEVWLRQNGYNFYSDDGVVQAKAEDIAAYWNTWKEMRDAGIVLGPDNTARLDKQMGEFGVITGESAMTEAWSNQFVAVQSLMSDPVGAAMYPHKKDGEFGQFIKPSQFISMTRDCEDEEAAALYINDWINDPEETAILGLERGIPGNPNVRAALEPNFSKAEALSVAYFSNIQDKVGALPKPEPKGAGEVKDAFKRIGTDVVLGNISTDEAAGIFVEDAVAIIDRAQ